MRTFKTNKELHIFNVVVSEGEIVKFTVCPWEGEEYEMYWKDLKTTSEVYEAIAENGDYPFTADMFTEI